MKTNWNSIKQQIERDFPDVPAITTEELAMWMGDTDRAAPILFDARGSAEFDTSHLRGAVHVPNAETASRLIDAYSNEVVPTIVVYCSVGYRSANVVDQLIKNGVENIYNLEGSIFQWYNEGRPVFQKDRQVDEVHPYDATWGKLLRR